MLPPAGFLRKVTLLLGTTLLLSFATATSITVAHGDSLWSIAQAHGTSVAELQRLNNLTTDALRIGQTLIISEAAPTAPVTITVVAGDTLWNLARAHGTTVAELRALNQLTTDALSLGQKLVVRNEVVAEAAPAPVAEAAEVATAADAVADNPVATQAATEAATTPESVTVQPGDTLYVLAQKYEVTVEDLQAWNNLDGSALQPGQVLAVSAPRPETVTLSAGDSLWTLADALGVTAEELAEANSITLATVLDPGTTLRVPNANTLAVGGPAPLSVQVRPGDSLWSLASVHGSSVESLMETNGLQNDRLVVGQTLTITPESIATPKPKPNPDGLIWPLDGIITSHFGYRVLFGSNFHNGLDINGNTGDPIRAAVGGIVTFAGWHGGYGNLLVITNNDKEYYYAHASKLLVTAGEVVEQGDLIALVGSTGNSTGAHLHFEIRIDGESVDPLPHLPTRAGL